MTYFYNQQRRGDIRGLIREEVRRFIQSGDFIQAQVPRSVPQRSVRTDLIEGTSTLVSGAKGQQSVLASNLTLPGQAQAYDEVNAFKTDSEIVEKYIFLKQTNRWHKFGEIPIVTQIPSSPNKGDEVYFNDSGTYWHFLCFEPDEIPYPWVFLGGAPKFDIVPTSEQCTSSTYSNLATPGPTITVALPGEYDIEIGARTHSSTPNQEFWMSYSIGATAAADADALDVHSGPNGTVSHTSFHAYRFKRKTLSSANTTVQAKYRNNGAGLSSHWTERSLVIRPVRVAKA